MNKKGYTFMIDVLNKHFDKNKYLSYGQIAYLLETISWQIYDMETTLKRMDARKDEHKEVK